MIGRATFFFEQGKYGWTETFWKNVDDLRAVLSSADELAKERMKLSGAGVTLTHIRASDDAVRRDAEVAIVNRVATKEKIEVDGGVMQRIPVIVKDDADAPYSALLLRMSNGAKYHRNHFLRGIPDIELGGPHLGEGKQGKDWKSLLHAWGLELVRGAWGFMAQDKDGGVIKNITAMTNAVPPVVTVAGHGYATGDRVHIEAVKGANVPRGYYTVEKVTDDTFKAKEHVVASTYVSGGTARKIVRVFKPIQTVVAVRQVKKNTGRPFGLPRGRRSAR